MTDSTDTVPATSGRIWLALILVAFLSGGVAGAATYGTLMTKPAQPSIFQATAAAGKAHATASVTAFPATEADAVLRRLAYRTICVPTRIGLVPYSEVEGCILAYLAALETPNTREGQPGAVTPHQADGRIGKAYGLDPETAAWYANMAKQGLVPMTIMVPKE